MAKTQEPVKTIRCAIYTRKSTEEGLEQEFNSLDAQRESGESYISSQKHEGWQCLPEKYDDGGYTGGNMERPALKRLLADVREGKIDCIVVYKVDRLSRSLWDFARIMDTLEKNNVSFVSVTQQFNTTTSMGRLTLNILLSFAQFEREIVSERTRDKIAAARRKGKWSGGRPVLGYDVVEKGGKLTINETEAMQVREIFKLYLETENLTLVVKELDRRGWTNKKWTNRAGTISGGNQFTIQGLRKLLINVLYIGKVSHKGTIYEGEQPGIIDPTEFQRVRAILKTNRSHGGQLNKNVFGFLLKGIIRCASCECAMVHAQAKKEGKKRYRYYVCLKAQKRGWHSCQTKSVPAPEIEKFVIDEIRSIGKDKLLISDTLQEMNETRNRRAREIEVEKRSLQRQIYRDSNTVKEGKNFDADRLAALQDRILTAEKRLTELSEELIKIGHDTVSEEDATRALALFSPVWDTLSLREQARVMRLLVERVDYDGDKGTVALTFRPSGIMALAEKIKE